ncbi:MAG: hypothetical protein ABMA64_11580 [Myxococcota bacterium]
MNAATMARIREALDRYGMLPAHDPQVPSVTNLVAGRPIRGSWLGDPAGRQIYLVLNALAAEVAWPKLLGGEVTLVHQRLWGALAAVGEQSAAWQTAELGEVEAAALAVVRSKGEVSSDDLGLPAGTKPSKVLTELERRLLVIAEHEQTGHHARAVRTWAQWMPGPRPELGEAIAALEGAADQLGVSRDVLPWSPARIGR